ncbi:MAG: type II toxin-antitoxin system YafQ family toxin [Oscillospiraceae bacterium]|jgi:mRNA interferase YafQ|nr:type II toxin-antitoxin system YafQ family toxin [Oscillospiraceae bacterium]
MLTLRVTGQFKRDRKLAAKRRLNIQLLDQVIMTLLEEKPLPTSMRDHSLGGAYSGYRECHLQPDWILMYYVERDNLVLVAYRTGTHADLRLE